MDTTSLGPHGGPRTQGCTILVVDDEADIRLLVRDGLEPQGYEVLEATTVEEAREVLLSRPSVRLVISDVRMPGPKDGVDLACWLYNNRPGVFLILTSGYFPPDEATATPLVYGYRLPKPFRPSDILAIIKSMELARG